MPRVGIARSSGLPAVFIKHILPPAILAPAQVWFEAVNVSGLAAFENSTYTHLPQHHEYYYEWTIRGEPLGAWSKPQNLVAEHNNPNKRFGRKVGFVLPAAGDYVIDLIVTDRNGKTLQASTSTITVVTPESFFPDANRIYVDPDEDYTGVPAASARYSSLAAAEASFTGHATTPTWLLLRKGKQYPLTGVAAGSNQNGRDKMYFGDNSKVCYVSGFGSGANPEIVPGDVDVTRDTRNSMFNFREPKDMDWRTFTGLTFTGGYNPENWGGKGYSGAGISGGEFRHDGEYGFALLHDIKVSGTDDGFSAGFDSTLHNDGYHLMIADCEVDGWRDYGFFGGANNMCLCFAGNYFHQKPNTPTFGGKNGISTMHGPIRIPRGEYACVTMCDLFSRGGWDGNDQACLRLFPDSFEHQCGYVDRCTMVSGWEVIHLRRSSHGMSVPQNVVIEKCLTVGTGRTASHINSTRSGLTVRDMYFVDLNYPRHDVSFGNSIVYLAKDTNGGNVLPINAVDPLRFYGNTHYCAMDASNDGTNRLFQLIMNDEGYFDDVVAENNLQHKPAGDTTHTEAVPVSLSETISGILVAYNGIQHHFEPELFDLEEDVPNNGSFTLEYADVTDGYLYDGGVGTPTDQAYWAAIAGVDTNHYMTIARQTPEGWTINSMFCAELGHFTVNFGATNITITNTSGIDWSAGDRVAFMPDRTSLMPAMLTQYGFSSTIPILRPESGSVAYQGASAGRISPTDFFMQPRGENPSRGAFEPAA